MFRFFLNLHIVLLQPPLSPKKHTERIRGNFNAALLCILWMLSPGSTHASGRNETCWANWGLLWDIQISEDLWRTRLVISVFHWTYFSCPCVHAQLCICQTQFHFCLIHYILCHEQLVQFSSDFVAWLEANCKIPGFFPFCHLENWSSNITREFANWELPWAVN